MNQGITSRRTFCGAFGAGAALTALSRPIWAAVPPSDQIVMGHIGIGGQGTDRLKEYLAIDDVRIGAVCDVDQRHLDRAVDMVEKAKGYKPQAFHDFRKLLAVKEIDAVMVTTPDHWHSIPTLAAYQAGKDVFCEKPLSYSVGEGRAMADATLNYKRVSQMGNHIHNTGGNYRRVVEMVQSGKLGKINTVRVWKTGPTRSSNRNLPPTCPPELDYDFWLGPAPKHAYEPLRSHGSFRGFWDYSGGTFIDFWCHISDIPFWALDLKGAKSISSYGGRFFLTDSTECPDTMETIIEFPGLIYVFSLRARPPAGLEHMGDKGALFEGTEASLVANYGTHEIYVRGKKVDDFPRPPQSIPDSPGHHREFLDGIKSRNLNTTCNHRYGHSLSKYGLLANIAYRTGRRIYWDDEHERILGDPKANQFLMRNFRKPWGLKKQPRPRVIAEHAT